jgi:RluA family pseudouridine synthase
MEIPIHESFRDLKVMDYLGIIWPERSHRVLGELFASGRVRSRGKPVGANRQVGELSDLSLVGTLDDVPVIFSAGAPLAAIPILHEDDRLVALSKPSGVPVVPDRSRALDSVLGFLTRRELEARASKAPGEYLRFRVVHRIDRLTSGLVLVAKTAAVERALSADFEHRRVKKEYLALLSGVVSPARFTVHCPVVPGRKGKMRASSWPGPKEPPSSRDALTEFEVLERFRELTLVHARPLTGRTHQVRVHAWAAGHPLAIDPLYGRKAGGEGAASLPAIERLTLHALRYELPESWKEPRSFECPLPEDFKGALEAVRERERSSGG